MSETTTRIAEETNEMVKLCASMAAMAVIRKWKVNAEPEGAVTVTFTSVLGDQVELSAEAMRGYSKGFGTAFRYFTERGKGE